MFSKRSLSTFRWAARVLVPLLLINLILVGRLFFSQKYLLPGDTHRYWSLNALALLSIRDFNELPWWDPTIYNGYPLYYHFLSGWSNYLSPYYLPSLLLYKGLCLVHSVPISGYLLFHRLVYIPGLNLLALHLLGTQLVRHRLAQIFIPLVFSFSYFQTANLHDFYVFEAMTAPLFFLYAFVRYVRKQDLRNLMVLAIFTSMLLASLNNGHLMSAAFWCGAFVVLTLVFFPQTLRETLSVAKASIQSKSRRVRLQFYFGLCALFAALVASTTPIRLNAGHVLKYRDGAVDYATTNAITNHPMAIETGRIWSVVANWLPFANIDEKYLRIAWHGADYRYIGTVTIPLLFAAFFLGYRRRFVLISLLTYFLCNAFFIYTEQNLFYRLFSDNLTLIANTRNMSTIFPRGGASLFLVFAAAIGLDLLLRGRKGTSSAKPGSPKALATFRWLMVALTLAGVGLMAYPYLVRLKYSVQTHSAAHVGAYLAIFASFLWILSLTNRPKKLAQFGAIILFFVFCDLVISLSSRIGVQEDNPDYIGAAVTALPYKKELTIPDDIRFKPVRSESDNLFPKTYQGVYHNPWAIMWGIKEWLVLATRPQLIPLLENWNIFAHQMTEIPKFRFFKSAGFLSFSTIREIDKQIPRLVTGNAFYLHEPRLGAGTPLPMPGRYSISEFTPNRVVIETLTKEPGFLYFLDNYDPFWSATVDGVSATILRANYTFKAISLPAGAHRVVWTYNPYPVKYAYALFYLIFTGLLLSLVPMRVPRLAKLRAIPRAPVPAT